MRLCLLGRKLFKELKEKLVEYGFEFEYFILKEVRFGFDLDEDKE